MRQSFANKRVLITGGAGGMGKLMATEIAEQGGHLILMDINGQGLEEMNAAISKKGGAIHTYFCDISKPDMVEFYIKRIYEELGDIDILINNAGVVTGKNILDTSPEEMRRTLDVNTLGPMYLIRQVLPRMIERDAGHIVNIASAAGLIGTARLADYSASKFAMVGFDEALRNELVKMKSNVKTTVVCPFFVNTGMFDGVRTRLPFLLPILKEENVAHRIVRAIQKQKTRLWIPWIVHTIPIFRMLPTRWLDAVAHLLGVHKTMEDFKGRESAE